MRTSCNSIKQPRPTVLGTLDFRFLSKLLPWIFDTLFSIRSRLSTHKEIVGKCKTEVIVATA